MYAQVIKFERYQAEALVHRHYPVSALKGMICYSEKTKQQLESWLQQRSLSMPVFARTGWYF